MSEKVRERIEEWTTLREGRHGTRPKVKFEGTLFDWPDRNIHVSAIPGLLNYCTYQHGLTAKEYAETGLLPVPSEESQELMDGGIKGHKALGIALPTFPTEELPQRTLEALLTSPSGNITEFPIAFPFKGIYLSGKIDHIMFSNGFPLLVKEWKFTKNGKVKPDHIIQVKIYSYLIHKWLGVLNFKYVVEAWHWGSTSKLDLLEAEDLDLARAQPSDKVVGEFTQKALKEVEFYLDRANSFFTGEQECRAIPGYGCSFCPHGKDKCKYYEKPNWITGSFVGFDEATNTAIIDFRVS